MNLKIAIPVVDGRLLGHLGETKQFALVEADEQRRVMVRMQVVAAPPHEPGSFPRWLREQGVQVLIVGHKGIGQRALDNLIHHGVEVRGGRPGAPVDALVVACFGGQLPRIREECGHQHDATTDAHECQLAGFLKGQTAAH
jgi:predicted Fe-Mo cluster-binding NifX family protein